MECSVCECFFIQYCIKIIQYMFLEDSLVSVKTGSPGAVIKLLPCDHEIMGSSPGNSLLQKCREMLRT
jgi:hypothetical protein